MTPPDVNPKLWQDYLNGSRATDALFADGVRCPSQPIREQARCLCAHPKEDYCVFFNAVIKLAQQIGGATWQAVSKIQ